MKKYIRLALAGVCLIIMLFSVYKLIGIIKEYSTATNIYEDATELAISAPPAPSHSDVMPLMQAPLSVDFDVLRQTNPDVVGWIYCEDTILNYPVMQAEGNNYYLEHLFDGSYNKAGSITLDCRNSADFSDIHTIIYGHNMKNGSMFAVLKKYMSQEYYDEHPIIWIFTPDETYVLEAVAGYVTSAESSSSFDLNIGQDGMAGHIGRAIARSNFVSGIAPESVQRLVTLVTCSYEYDEARYILLCNLVTLDEYNARA